MIRATRNMLDFFERKGMKYSPDIDTTKAGKDVVTVTYTGDNKDTIRFKIFVDPDEDNVASACGPLPKPPTPVRWRRCLWC